MNFRPGNKTSEPDRNDQLPPGTPDIEIARSVAPQSILLLAQQRLGLPAESLIPFGHFKAKVDLSNIDTGTAHGKLVLVTAITPTPAGEGAKEVARLLVEQLAEPSAEVQMLYDDEDSLIEKIETIATTIYGASGVELFPEAKRQLAEFKALGFGHLPVCIAKTQYSFTADAKQTGEYREHTLPVREARLAAAAGFIVVVCGDVMTMPGLPRHPAALDIGLDENGLVEGLF